jgi:lipoprotein-anchoring transpeptidase ErfK/SrfK
MWQVISTAVVIVAISFGAFAEAQTTPPVAGRPETPKQAPKQAPKSQTAENRTLALQVALDRAGFSAGEIDGKRGGNTERALRAFQEANGLTPTGELDTATIERLGPAWENPLSSYAISAEDVAGPFVPTIPTDMMKKADLEALGYTSIREMLAERFHASPALLQRLNSNVQFKQGDVITVPNVEPFFVAPPKGGGPGAMDAARAGSTGTDRGRGAVSRASHAGADGVVVTITDKTKTLTVEDGAGKVIFHAPVTVGSTKDPLPVGEWKVNGVQRNPAFNYNPDLFWDADPEHSKAKLAPGPNNPVGTVWIDLSKEHYGIHGTPEPSRIGYTESHGCIRLTNWDAARLASMVAPGTKVVLR